MLKRVVVLDDEGANLELVKPLLNRDGLVVESYLSAVDLSEFKGYSADDILLVPYPLPDQEIFPFIRSVREGLGEDEQPMIVVMTEDCYLPALGGYGDDRLAIVSSDQPSDDVLSQVSAFFGAARRVPVGLTVHLKARVGEEPVEISSTTDNISNSGMLVLSEEMIPIGTPVSAELELPSGHTVHATAEVMRHASADDAGVTGMGLRFAQIDPEAEAVLTALIENRASGSS